VTKGTLSSILHAKFNEYRMSCSYIFCTNILMLLQRVHFLLAKTLSCDILKDSNIFMCSRYTHLSRHYYHFIEYNIFSPRCSWKLLKQQSLIHLSIYHDLVNSENGIWIIWLNNILTLSVFDDGYSNNARLLVKMCISRTHENIWIF
jgi:hypothetical protein